VAEGDCGYCLVRSAGPVWRAPLVTGNVGWSGPAGWAVPCQNSFIAADLPLRARQAARRYSLTRPPTTRLRSIGAVISTGWPGSRSGGFCCKP